MNTIFIVASHSGGHIIPALTIAQRLQQESHAKIVCITSDRPLDRQIMRDAPQHIEHIALYIEHPPLRRPWRLPAWIYKTMRSSIMVMRTMRMKRPTHIISTGGLSAVPVCIIGRLMGIPYELYELNATPGRAIQFLSRWADKVHNCFDLTKYPIRFARSDIQTCAEARRQLNISHTGPVILVLGGSQGAYSLNSLIMSLQLPPHSFVIHQTGTADYERVRTHCAQHRVQGTTLTVPYHTDMELLYSAADVIIARAGAGTIFESLFFGKKLILVSLEKSALTDHQVANAYAAQQKYPELVSVVRQTDVHAAHQLQNALYHAIEVSTAPHNGQDQQQQ